MKYTDVISQLNDDNHAWRPQWDNGVTVAYVYKDEYGTLFKCDKNGKVRKWEPTAKDIAATDWEINDHD